MPQEAPTSVPGCVPTRKSLAMEVSLGATNRSKRLVGKDAETQGGAWEERCEAEL